jgi:hypothetical protein
MMEIVLLLWILGPDGDLQPLERFSGWYAVGDCEDFVETLFARNPHDGFQLQGVARCVEVPK